MKFAAYLFCFYFLVSVSIVSAGLFDSMEDLEGKVVIIAGDVKRLSCPIGGQYDCLLWPSEFLRFQSRNFCFTSDWGACGTSCKGFIAVGKNKIPYFFKIDDGIMSQGLEKHSVNHYQCPDLF